MLVVLIADVGSERNRDSYPQAPSGGVLQRRRQLAAKAGSQSRGEFHAAALGWRAQEPASPEGCASQRDNAARYTMNCISVP